jgi:hypothetical protein
LRLVTWNLAHPSLALISSRRRRAVAFRIPSVIN